MARRSAHAASSARALPSLRLSWLATTTLRRTRTQWRLLAAVIAVALLASTLVTSLGLLTVATEQAGVRGALAAAPDQSVAMTVQLADPVASIADSLAAPSAAIADVLGTTGTATVTSSAVSRISVATLAEPPSDQPVITYFAERDGIRDHATLVSGEWAGDVPEGGPVPVTLPASAVGVAGLAVGDEFDVDLRDTTVTAIISGVYRANDPGEAFWGIDALEGQGSSSEFPNPAVDFFQATTAFGPLIVAPGAFASGGIPVSSLELVFHPEFSGVTVDELAPLLDRLDDADVDVVLGAGRIANTITYSSDAVETVSGIAASLISTRSTVVVVSLLLVVLALAALSQTARLFSDARVSERLLLTARGASSGHLLALAAVEAVVVGAIVAAASPPLAALVYRLLAAQAPMRAAGMPAAIGIPGVSWLTASAIGLAFVVVLLIPLLVPLVLSIVGRRSGSPEAPRVRQRAASGLMRSGIDVALVVLAGIAFWQLQSYRSPVASGGLGNGVDPVLAAGPALVLVAAALVCVRLIPAAARLVDAFGSGARGLGISLAAWEVGRRSQRATAAVLLLSLTLAVGTFGLAFLSTWKQSQVDQASFAAGAPVRVPVRADAASGQAATLADGAVGSPQPVTHRSATVRLRTLVDIPQIPTGARSQVLGLTADARELLDRGRLADLGGSQVAGALVQVEQPADGVDLPGDSRGISVNVRVSATDPSATSVATDVFAVVQDSTGLLSTVALKPDDKLPVVVDGQARTLQGRLALPDGVAELSAPVRLVAMQATFRSVSTKPDQPQLTGPIDAEFLVRYVSVVGADEKLEPVELDPGITWSAVAAAKTKVPPTAGDAPDGWQLRLAVQVPQDVLALRTSFALVGWRPVSEVPALITEPISSELMIGEGMPLALSTQGVLVPIRMIGSAPMVPGSASTADLVAIASGLTPSTSGDAVVVVDQEQLARALVQAGATGTFADEWWIDVPPSAVRAWIDAHPDEPDARSSELIGESLQQGPLRVATQAALWLTIVAGALLAAVGFIVHTSATLRARRLELAQLRAIGLSRGALVRLIAGESLLMSALGTIFGVAIGLLLVVLVGPLIVVSPFGEPPIPDVVVQVPWTGIAALVAIVIAVLALIVVAVARVQRFVDPAQLLREGAAS